MEKCSNCSRLIGNLETPYVYQNNVVCSKCSDILQPPVISTVAAPIGSSLLIDRTKATSTCPRCPACGYTGIMKRKSKGSVIIMIFLLLLWILPGLIYAILNNGYQFVCPMCGAKVADVG